MRHAMIGLGMALYAMACSPALAAGEVVGVEHWVENADTRIYVWEKFTDKPTGKKIVVLAHGSATAGKESFDLQVPGVRPARTST